VARELLPRRVGRPPLFSLELLLASGEVCAFGNGDFGELGNIEYLG
jgi:hypothetical protein